MSDLTTLVVGPDQTLVLVSRSPLTPEMAERINTQVPKHLRGRLVVVSDMDAYVVDSNRLCCTDGSAAIGGSLLKCDLLLDHDGPHHDNGATWTRLPEETP